MMNPHQNLILIKGEDKTLDIDSIRCEGDRMVVTFRGGKSFPYGKRSVDWRRNPEPMQVQRAVVSVRDDVLSDVVEAFRFDDWVRVFHGSGESRSCPLADFRIVKKPEGDGRSQDVLAYYRELAACNELRTDKGDSLLSLKFKQLERVPHDTLLASFLSGKLPIANEQMLNSHATNRVQSHSQNPFRRNTMSPFSQFMIFPFGCNMSQKTAVEKALGSSVSLIQGPPGTGKTQTILNLIANLLLMGKQMAIVSNNNSATENVQEKMEKHHLNFLCAFLGSKENKIEFISNQDTAAIQLERLSNTDSMNLKQEVMRLNQELDTAYNQQNELASICSQLDALALEWTHFNVYARETEPDGSVFPEGKRFLSASSEKLVALLVRLLDKELPLEGSIEHPMRLWERLQLALRFGPSRRQWREAEQGAILK